MTNHEEQINYQKFNKFDIIPHDRHYIYDHRLSRSNQTLFSLETTALIKKEWKELEKSLPDSIYVRAYEGRIDLLRAVVVGQPGTPYYQGLFFYDIQLTLGYPNSPPNVVSLLTEGKLLKPSNDMVFYRPERSNNKDFSLLKVLLTIHEHVVSTDSYFNYKLTKPSHNPSNYYLITHWGMWKEKKFLSYDQEMFLLNCQTMLGVLDKPYKHFEDFVGQHFRDHAKSILIAAQGYIDDEGRSRVSKFVDDDHSIQIVKPRIKDELEEYRKSMSITYVKLIKAFIKNGSPDFLECYYNLNDDIHDDVQEDGGAKKKTKKKTCDPFKLLVIIVGGTYSVCVLFACLSSQNPGLFN